MTTIIKKESPSTGEHCHCGKKGVWKVTYKEPNSTSVSSHYCKKHRKQAKEAKWQN